MTSTHTPHPDCLALFEKLSEFIDKELDEPTYREIDRHAQTCEKCRTCLETLRRTAELCGSLNEFSVPETFSARLLAYLKSRMKGKGA